MVNQLTRKGALDRDLLPPANSKWLLIVSLFYHCQTAVFAEERAIELPDCLFFLTELEGGKALNMGRKEEQRCGWVTKY